MERLLVRQQELGPAFLEKVWKCCVHVQFCRRSEDDQAAAGEGLLKIASTVCVGLLINLAALLLY